MGALRREVSPWRLRWVVLALVVGVLLLLFRAVHLQILNQGFLKGQGDARQVRIIDERASRGSIFDRNGEPLAISGPVMSVWAHPATVLMSAERLPELGRALDLNPDELFQQLRSRSNREFVFMRRHLSPERAQLVHDLGVPGISLMREFRRYYPHGEAVSHVIGLTNIDERGQEGIERVFDGWLSGEDGRKMILQDRRGRRISDIAQLQVAREGNDLRLTIDQRLQFLAYRELKTAVSTHSAVGGAAILVDARTGDILALVNQPGFNPNNRAVMEADAMRNRGVTDVFEPGSVIKPFTVAAALDSGVIDLNVQFDTDPGFLRVGRHTVRDIRNFGTLDLTEAIARSSNITATRMALDTPPDALWGLLHRAGFGRSTGVSLPGEVSGSLRDFTTWRTVERATLGYGYGLSVTLMQLASAYTAFANDGYRVPLQIVETADDGRLPEKVMSPVSARALLEMMEHVTGPTGTALTAAVPGYRIAGKTGTAHKVHEGGYARDRYLSMFAGIAPASDPRLVMIVVLDEPRGGAFYGGVVAGPVFRAVMESALRLLNIPPDQPDVPRLQAAQSPSKGAS